MRKKKIKLSEIKDEVLVCPYCMCDVDPDWLGCCGESRDHFSNAYVVGDDYECYLEHEVEVVMDE